LTDVAEVLTASIIRAITLMMETVSTSQVSVSFYTTILTRRDGGEWLAEIDGAHSK
jgi:hypothetical protein